MKILAALSTLVFSTGLVAAELTLRAGSTNPSFPPADSAWKGTSAHIFLGGQVMMFCGTHGVISGGSELPMTNGASIEVDYRAEFTGELTLSPPLVSATQVITLSEPIRMTERITHAGQRRGVTSYTTELTTVEFSDTAFPRSIRIRESRERASAGRATVSRQADGNYSIQAAYNVWLEISVDGGRTWDLASEAVTMQLEPEIRNAVITPVPGVIRRQR